MNQVLTRGILQWMLKMKTLNTLYNSSYSIQEALEIQPCILCSWYIHQGQPIYHSSHSNLHRSHRLTSPCQMSLRESILLLTISHLQLLGNLHGDSVCPEQQLGEDWRKEGHPLVVLWLSNKMVRKKESLINFEHILWYNSNWLKLFAFNYNHLHFLSLHTQRDHHVVWKPYDVDFPEERLKC